MMPICIYENHSQPSWIKNQEVNCYDVKALKVIFTFHFKIVSIFALHPEPKWVPPESNGSAVVK